MHTKERLKISEITGSGATFSNIVQSESGRIIAFLAHHPGQHPKEEAMEQEQADAERLVEAWNKMEAIAGLVEAAEEMARTLAYLRNENDRKHSATQLSNHAMQVVNATLSAWEKAGKGNV